MSKRLGTGYYDQASRDSYPNTKRDLQIPLIVAPCDAT